MASVPQQSAAAAAATQQALPQLITNAQGQIVAIGTPSVKVEGLCKPSLRNVITRVSNDLLWLSV